MPTLSSVQNSVDTTINALITAQISPLQTTFFGTHSNRYFQGLLTTSFASLPNNTDAGILQVMVPVLTVASPLFPTETWVAFGLVLASAPCSVEIFYYNNASGKGFQLNTYIKHTAKTYVRQRNVVGGETYREQNWIEFVNGVN